MKLLTSYRLTEIEHAVAIARALNWHWFRGQSKPYGELTPAVYRDYKPNADYWFVDAFRRRIHATNYESPLPEYDDIVSWIMLMQHHGTPTRLLDWTTSILVALYFAVNEDNSEDGELWAVDPFALNKLSGYPGNIHWNEKIVLIMAGMPQTEGKSKKDFLNTLNLDENPKYPLAFIPPNDLPRMISQMSRFTLHPQPEKGFTIPELLQDKRKLVRYTIPSDRKGSLLRELRSLGITRSTLYGDPDDLSISLKEEVNDAFEKYELHEPPVFDV
jgi:hypothetical protein